MLGLYYICLFSIPIKKEIELAGRKLYEKLYKINNDEIFFIGIAFV